jgi:hypothetical protein
LIKQIASPLVVDNFAVIKFNSFKYGAGGMKNASGLPFLGNACRQGGFEKSE